MDCLNIMFEDSLDLEERFEHNIHLVERLIADNKPSQTVVKKVLRSAWNKMGLVRVLRAKANVYAITAGEEAVIGVVLEVENSMETGFRGFLRMRVDFDAKKKNPLFTSFLVPCPSELIWRPKRMRAAGDWESRDIGFYGLPNMEADILANTFLARMKDKESAKSPATWP
ncbi:hypothetical protein D8674_037447 [Pyrus ussuriensis x Pyrus communis]|uniref:DUF4283 domain-containing protein n=1 Tax=Pyrus ussuriensis x Pyrus communis TaxID=2448454 RepID=A0A5N5H133_9ROSA|nr:hypothetical protein D8674_037447 [Pyrus ussuriensis x Pyrus communis]